MDSAAASWRPSLKRRIPTILGAATLLLLLVERTQAHEHHDEDLPPGEAISPEPIVSTPDDDAGQICNTDSNKDIILWAHILLQIATWGLIFPTGMVLGITRSRWHVPVQVFGTLLAIVGYFLGHKHGGRRFGHNVHSSYAPWLGWLLTAQVILGIYLKLHIERGFLGKIRKVLVVSHGVIGKALPLAAWVQMLFGGIVSLGFCRDDHLGQCAAHFIMGSAFIAYGIILTLLLSVGQFWLQRTGRSQEFFDSVVITVWGCVNTFTEHRWGDPWVHNDLQHTTMGIIWWCAGLVGIWLSRRRDGRPKRNLIPGIVILLTGFGMSAHPQTLMLSTMVHAAFGWTLMAAGATRIIEISFVLKDKPALDMTGDNPNSFQYLPPFLLYASGFLFMAATEEQMAMLASNGVTHVTYILLLYSMAFLMFLFVNVLLHIYAVWAFPPSSTPSRLEAAEDDDLPNRDGIELNGVAGKERANGGLKMSERESRRAKEAEEFELDALISDSEDGDERRPHRIQEVEPEEPHASIRLR